jgi:hypothetical protein
MIKKITLIFLIFLLFSQCGYQPIYSTKNINFNINKLETVGELKIGKIIAKKLANFGEKGSTKNDYNLIIFSEINKNITSKDKKGNPTTFSLNISVRLTVTDALGKKKEKVFNQTTSFNNNSNKFDLKKYENSLKKNLSEKIADDIIQYLQGLNN